MRRPAWLVLLLAGCQLLVDFQPVPEGGAQCDDRVDNDGDGDVDCADDGCQGAAACAAAARCGNGVVDPPLARWRPQTVAVSAPVAIAAGPIDDDARPDLVVASRGGEVRELRNAAGGFSAQGPVTVPGARLTALGAGILDGRTVDVLVLDDLEPGAWRILNGGAGAWGTPQRVATLGPSPAALALGDFDGDQDLDAVAAGAGGTSFLANDGRGGLRAVALQVPAAPAALAAADLDGDGRADVACAARDRSSAFVLYGGGAGSVSPFTAGEVMAVGTSPIAIAIADVDRMLGPDLLTANQGSSDVSVLLDRGDRVYAAGRQLTLPDRPTALAAGDLDGDGDADLVVGLASGAVGFWFGDGKGGFVPGGQQAVGGAQALLVADLDGDGRPDVVVVGTAAGQVTVLLNDVVREDCDDGNTMDGDSCPADCTF